MTDLQHMESSKIQEMVHLSKNLSDLTVDKAEAVLSVLKEYECWDPYFRVMRHLLGNVNTASLELFLDLAQTQNLFLEDVFGAAETCSRAVKTLQLKYSELIELVLPKILSPDDYAAEAAILSSCGPLFADRLDHILALERLSLLYEKKIHNERLLTLTYDKLIAIDPGNIKALRYFKLLHTQNNEWEEVALTLRALLANVTYPQETYRVAQELAAVLLYQLSRAKEALQVLESFCSDSPLDTTTILYDAFEQMGRFDGCLKILRQYLITTENPNDRSKILYKIGKMEEKIGKFADALEHYQTAFESLPSFFEAAESIVNLAIPQKKWDLVEKTLTNLEDNVRDQRLKGQINHALRRLRDGVKNASST